MSGAGHQQQIPPSLTTGNNTSMVGGHGLHDRSGVGGGNGVGPNGTGGPGVGVGGGGGNGVGGPGGPHCQMSGSQPLVMPAFPLRNAHSAHTSHYSPYSPSR